MPTFLHLRWPTPPAGLSCLLALAAGCVSTSEGEIAPLREEVSALRQAHDADRKRLEALEVQMDAQQVELRRLRGGSPAPERSNAEPEDSQSLPVVRLKAPGRATPALPTDVSVHEPPAEVVAELERAHVRALDEQTAGGGGSREEADRVYDVAFEKLKTGELVAAAGMFRDFARRYPHHPAADNALLDEGIAFYGLRRYQEALDVFQSLTHRYPAGDAVAEARLRAGDCQIKLGEISDAQATLRGIISSYPGSPEAAKAATQLAAIQGKPGERAQQGEDLAKTEGESE